MALTDAMGALGRLDSAASFIPNPQLVTRVATRREAIGTSAIEGTFANLTELFTAEAAFGDEVTQAVPANVREVMNPSADTSLALDAALTVVSALSPSGPSGCQELSTLR